MKTKAFKIIGTSHAEAESMGRSVLHRRQVGGLNFLNQAYISHKLGTGTQYIVCLCLLLVSLKDSCIESVYLPEVIFGGHFDISPKKRISP